MGERIADSPGSWMLVPASRGHHRDPAAPRPSRIPLLVAVARRALPDLLESTIVPAVLFFVLVTTVNAAVAMAAVLVWAYGALLRRTLRKDRIPALLVLATVGLTVRTVIGLLSGSTFAYFVQPVATTVVLAAVFLGSAALRRPVIARVAHDFCPFAAEVAERPGVSRLFGNLTVVWAGAQLLTAGMTLAMLVTMPVAMFVALKTVAALGISVAAVVITISLALRTVHSEHLVFAQA
jgi:hypothetical protein